MSYKSYHKRKVLKLVDLKISYMALAGLRGEYVFPQSQIGRPNHIEKLVCDYFGQHIDSIRGKKRHSSLVAPRQILMFLLRRYTNLSQKDIGKLYNRDHTTVIHSVSVVLDRMETEPDYRKEIVYLEAKITDVISGKPNPSPIETA